jgi:hypothetical protein
VSLGQSKCGLAISNQRLNFPATHRTNIGHACRQPSIHMNHLDPEAYLRSKSVHHEFHHLALSMVWRRHMCKDEKFHPKSVLKGTGIRPIEWKSIA